MRFTPFCYFNWFTFKFIFFVLLLKDLSITASNPSGRTIPTDRKREIYQICCKYNIIILEDDAYYFLHFLDEQPVSFLSLDTEGRVIRLDSMSKVLSSGLRLGWLIGPKKLVENIEIHISSCIIHSSVLSQVRNFEKIRLTM